MNKHGQPISKVYADGGGLYLHVNKAGARSWILRYMLDGRAHEMGLGPLALVSLKEARELALQYRRKVRLEGKDPIAERRGARTKAKLDAAKVISFKAAAQHYIAANKDGWKSEKHAAQWPATLGTYVYPIIGDLPVQAIDTNLVLQVLEQEIDDGPAGKRSLWIARPETAGRVRGRIESIIDYAMTRTWRQGENSARWRGHLENVLPKKAKVHRVEHHAALDYREVPEFMTMLRQQHGIAARALELAILCGSRTGEIIGARWGEIDFLEETWIVPAVRIKSGAEHRIPLSEPAMALLQQLHELRGADDKFVLAGGKACRPLSNMSMLMLLRRMQWCPRSPETK